MFYIFLSHILLSVHFKTKLWIKTQLWVYISSNFFNHFCESRIFNRCLFFHFFLIKYKFKCCQFLCRLFFFLNYPTYKYITWLHCLQSHEICVASEFNTICKNNPWLTCIFELYELYTTLFSECFWKHLIQECLIFYLDLIVVSGLWMIYSQRVIFQKWCAYLLTKDKFKQKQWLWHSQCHILLQIYSRIKVKFTLKWLYYGLLFY